MNDLFEEEYLKRLRADYRKVLEGDGGNCPCCERWGKINTFHLDETNALSLLWMKKNEKDADGWIHTAKVAPRWMMRAKSFSTMRHWGLVESAPNDDKEKKGAGVWRLTNKAHNFIGGKVRLPKKAFVYNRTLVAYGDQEIYISECFGKRFNYEEVMSDRFDINQIQS
jgi:hypothetical protein